MAQAQIGDESTETRAARDFDLLSVLNGYPEVLSVFQGDELLLRVARKPGLGLPLPRLLMRVLWRVQFVARLRQRMLTRMALRSAPESAKRAAHVKAVDVYDRVTGTLICSQTISEPPAIFRQMPASHKDNGGNYICRISLDTTGWPVGVYECVVRDDRGAASQDIYVNIKPQTLENVDLLCILPSFTWQAYNRVGGGSFYSPELGDVRTICTQRPMHHRGDNSIAPALDLLSLFQSRGVRFACIDSWDLHHNRLPLGEAPVSAILVHDEYWSAPMRAQLDRLLDFGTAILVLSGNTCWWHVEVEGQNISVRKESGKRALWHLVGAAEEQTLVSSFRFGGYAMERAKQKPRLAGRIANLSEVELRNAGAITVTDLGHPVFAGVTLGDDRLFGREVPVVYRELDGVPLSKDGKPTKAGYKAPSLTPHVIATALALYGKKLRRVGLVVEARVRNGYVLHMGSIGWARGVSQKDAEVTKVVLNAYEHCRAKAAETRAESNATIPGIAV
jgi:hypothetical protein